MQHWRKQFYIGLAESLDTFQCMENVTTCRHTGYLYCTKHNQHVKHTSARGSGGMSPRKILKNGYSEMGAFLDLTIAISHFN